MDNPIVQLALLSQKLFKESIVTEVIAVEGKSHNPVVTVQITLPNNQVFKATSGNKKDAKQLAATLALMELNKATE